MFVQKMPPAAGYESFPFIPSFQAEKEQAEAVFAVMARAEMELAVIKAKAEEESLIVKAGCGSKRKAEEDGEEVSVKAKVTEEAAFNVKSKAEVEAAITIQAKAEEEAAITIKAKVAEEPAFTVKAKAKAEEESAFTVKAKAEEEVEDSDSDCGSEEESESDGEEFMAWIRADHAAHVEKMKAMYPTIKYGDYDPEEYCSRSDPEDDAWNLQKRNQGLVEIAALMI